MILQTPIYAGQLVSLDAAGGIIDTSESSELGFRVEQRLIDIDDGDTNQASSPVTATNDALQVLGIDSDNGARVEYDTLGLSLVSQTIDDCSFGQADCLNSVGDPTQQSPTLTNGQRAQLTAVGADTTIDVDNLRQLVNQDIENFENAPNRDATNRADTQLFFANAANGGEIDMALSDVTEQTQSISQSITDSNRNTLNTASQRIDVGDNPTTTVVESVQGLVEADVDQELTQSISWRHYRYRNSKHSIKHWYNDNYFTC